MFKIKVNNRKDITVEKVDGMNFLVDGKNISPDIVQIKDGLFHVILNNKSFNAEIVSHDPVEKTFEIKVNRNTYSLQVKDRYDDLLKELGMDTGNVRKAADLKAPMPGLVVEIAVKEGQQVKQGEKLVVLEAMKMENILKAPTDVTIRKVNVAKGNTVEKNEVLVLFT
jgi:acetyl/propionyl-CoA carboxylase alpha subunit